jgi:hypothetical protein
MLVSLIVSISANIIDESVVTLESVFGRKNPSANQNKQLKRCIPNTIVIKALITSQVNDK